MEKGLDDRLEVVSDGSLTLKSYDVGAVKTWVRIPTQYQGSLQGATKEAEWIAWLEIIKERLNEADCILIQPTVQARNGKEDM